MTCAPMPAEQSAQIQWAASHGPFANQTRRHGAATTGAAR